MSWANNVHQPPIPKAVKIKGTRYSVGVITYSPARGYEYQLKLAGQVVRVCHAPPRKVGSCLTSGETIHYEW